MVVKKAVIASRSGYTFCQNMISSILSFFFRHRKESVPTTVWLEEIKSLLTHLSSRRARRLIARTFSQKTREIHRRFSRFYKPYSKTRASWLLPILPPPLSPESLLLATRWLLKKHASVAAEFRALEVSLARLSLEEASPKRLLELALLLDDYAERTAFRFSEETLASTLNDWQEEWDISLSLSETEAISLILRLLSLDKLSAVAVSLSDIEDARIEAERFYAKFGPNESRRNALLKKTRRRNDQYADLLEEALLEIFARELKPLSRFSMPKAELPPDSPITSTKESFRRNITTRTRILIRSLALLGEFEWRTILKKTNALHRLLVRDPAEAYTALASLSQEAYRKKAASLALALRVSEECLARTILELSETPETSPENHVGFYLFDEGVSLLIKRLTGHSRLPFRHWHHDRKRLPLLRGAYFLFIASLILSIGGILSGFVLFSSPSALLLFPLLYRVAKHFADSLFLESVPPTFLPRLNLRRARAETIQSVFVIPAFLRNAESLRTLIGKLETAFLSNRKEPVSFCLLLDFPDADTETRPEDEKLVNVARTLFQEINARYGETDRFWFFLRSRIRSDRQERWMGWERKRGKLLDFARFLRGRTTSSPFISSRSSKEIPRINFIITLDEDAFIPRDFIRDILGVHAHPLQLPCPNGEGELLRRGYTFIQPAVKQWFKNRERFRLPRIFFDEKCFSIYPNVSPEIYQDIFLEGSYAGKGSFHVDAFLATLDHTLPSDHILSHDLLEGSLARTAFAADIEVFDEFPKLLRALLSRSNRWTRGDWQILDWIFPNVKSEDGSMRRNILRGIHRFKIVDNCLQSLFRPSVFLLTILFPIFDDPALLFSVWIIFLFDVALLDMGLDWTRFTFRILSGRWKHTFFQFRSMLLRSARFLRQAAFECAVLPFAAIDTLSAIVTALFRRLWSGKHMLEWTPSAHFENPAGRESLLFPLGILLLVSISLFLERALHPFLIALLSLWMATPFFVAILNRPYRRARLFSKEETESLSRDAFETWSFFADTVSAKTHFLPPDSIRFEPSKTVASYTSITNIGFFLISIIVASRFGCISKRDARRRLLEVVGTLETLETYKGHFYNWYDIRTTKPAPPLFISSVDSGNLLASIIVTRQWIASEQKRTEEVESLLRKLDRFIATMRFDFLKSEKRGLLSIGYHVPTRRLETRSYQTLASEARIANLLALAEGTLSFRGWNKLNRTVIAVSGKPALISWTGTLFEYLMPALFLEERGDSLVGRSIHTAIDANRRFAKKHRLPVWGLSESGYAELDRGGNYRYKPFGLPALSLSPGADSRPVVSAYVGAMSLLFSFHASFKNLRAYSLQGGRGQYGYIEAIDFHRSRHGAPVRSFMSHHQGMILAALGNLLFDHFLIRLFESHPLIQNSLFVADESVPPIDKEPFPRPAPSYLHTGILHPRTP